MAVCMRSPVGWGESSAPVEWGKSSEQPVSNPVVSLGLVEVVSLRGAKVL